MERIFNAFVSRLHSPELLSKAIRDAGEAHDLLTFTDTNGRTLIAFPFCLSLPPPVAPDGVEAVFLTLTPSADSCAVSVALTWSDGVPLVVDLPQRLPASVLWSCLSMAGLTESPNYRKSDPFLNLTKKFLEVSKSL